MASIQTIHLVGGQLRALAIGVQARGPQDLIGIGITDAGHELAARQDALDLAAERLEPLPESLERDLEGLRSQAGILGHSLQVAA